MKEELHWRECIYSYRNMVVIITTAEIKFVTTDTHSDIQFGFDVFQVISEVTRGMTMVIVSM